MFNVNEKTLGVYQQKVRAQIKELKAKMQMLEADAEKTSADMRIQYQKNLDDWKSRFQEIEMKLDKLSESAKSGWNDIRSGIDKAMNKLSNSIENATKHFNN